VRLPLNELIEATVALANDKNHRDLPHLDRAVRRVLPPIQDPRLAFKA
jgi:hypothetical protein